MTTQTPPRPVTMASRLVLPLLSGLKRRGSDVTAMLSRLGLDERELRSLNGRLTMEGFMDLHNACVAETGDRAWPLRMAADLDREAFPLAFYLLSTQATLREGFRFVEPYRGTIIDRIEYQLIEHGELAQVRFDLDGHPLGPPTFAEYLLVLVLALGRLLIPDSPPPTEIIFAHKWPRHCEDWMPFVQCPVRYGADAVAYVFPNPRLNTPIAGADPHLGQVLASTAESWMVSQITGERLRDRARRWLGLRRLEQGEPTAAEVASALRMSERTLRRKLESEGASVRELLDDVRRERAVSMLEDGAATVDEIAYKLGFSGSSAFRRAFKRWTGKTPAGFGGPDAD